MTYTVEWRISDVEAKTPKGAAKQILKDIRSGSYSDWVWFVTDEATGTRYKVDLDENTVVEASGEPWQLKVNVPSAYD